MISVQRSTIFYFGLLGHRHGFHGDVCGRQCSCPTQCTRIRISDKPVK